MKEWLRKYKRRIISGGVSGVACIALCVLWCGMTASKVSNMEECTEQVTANEEVHTEQQEPPQETETPENPEEEMPEVQKAEEKETEKPGTEETPVQENSTAAKNEKIAPQNAESEIDRSGGVAKSVEVNRGGTALKETGDISYLGTFRTTAYCSCASCSEGWGNQTATGVPARPNRTIAVDPKVIKLGSRVVIDGKEYVAEDTGGAIKGNKIDIYFANHAEAMQFGVRSKEVYLAK